MTKKDYVIMASYLREARAELADDENQLLGFTQAILAVSNTFQRDNPNFDKERFFDAVVRPYGE